MKAFNILSDEKLDDFWMDPDSSQQDWHQQITNFAWKPNAFDKLILNDENLSYVLLIVQFLACDNLPQNLRQLAPRVGQVVSLKAQHKSLHISKTNRNILEILSSCKTYWHALPPEWWEISKSSIMGRRNPKR